jgi:hypothetical protein
VNNDVILERTIPTWGSKIPRIHPHLTWLTIRWSRKICVVGAGPVLDGDFDAIIPLPTRSNLGMLEVVCLLSEAVLVRDVMQRVRDVERIHDGKILVSRVDRIG